MNRWITRVLKKILRIAGYALAMLISLFLVGTLIFHIPAIQNRLADKAETFIRKKTNSHVSIEGIALTLPGSIKIKGLFAVDTQNDTLIYLEKLVVEANLLALLHNTIDVNFIKLENSFIQLKKFTDDGQFNFQPFVAAFSKEGDTKPKKDTTAGEMNYSLNQIDLENVRFSYSDTLSDNTYSFNVGSLLIRVNSLAIKEKQYEIQSIILDSFSGYMAIYQKEHTKPEPIPIKIALTQKLEIKQSSFQLHDYFQKQVIQLETQSVFVTPEELNLPEKTIRLDEIKLKNTQFAFQKNTLSVSDSIRIEKFNAEKYPPGEAWKLSVNEIDLDKNQVRFRDDNKPSEKVGIDFANLALDELNASIHKISIGENTYQGDIEKLELKEQSGFILNNLSSHFTVNNNEIILSNFNLRTPYSHIEQNLKISYSGFNQFTDNPLAQRLNWNLKPSEIGLQDMFYLAPELIKNSNIETFPKNKGIKLQAALLADGGEAKLEKLLLNFDDTRLALHGTMRNLTKPKEAYYNVLLDTFYTSRSNLLQFIPDSLLPDSLNLPEHLALSAEFKGRTHKFTASAVLKSTLGELALQSKVDQINPDKLKYTAEVKADEIDPGSLLGIDTLGPVSFTTNLEGIFEPDSITRSTAKLKANISKLRYNAYNYREITIEGEFENRSLEANLSINDSNLVVDLKSKLDLKMEQPSYQLNLQILAAALDKLHLVSDPISLRGKMHVEGKGFETNMLNSKLTVDNLYLLKNSKAYNLDSIYINLENKPEKTNFKLASEPLIAELTSNQNLGSLRSVMKSYINNYCRLFMDSTDAFTPDTTRINFKVEVNNSELLTQVFLPNLKGFMPGTIEGEFNSKKEELSVNGYFPHVQYGNNTLDSIKLMVNANAEDPLEYVLSFQNIAAPPFKINETSLSGSAADDTLTLNFKVLDQSGEKQYSIKSKISSVNNRMVLHLLRDSLRLNYTNFEISGNSSVVLSDSESSFDSLHIESGEQQASIINLRDQDKGKAKLELRFGNFKLSNLTGLVESSKHMADGTLSGTVKLGASETTPAIESDLRLTDIVLFDQPAFETAELETYTTTDQAFAIRTNFKGQENAFKLEGELGFGVERNSLDFLMDIDQINLAFIEPFVTEEFTTLKGNLSGKIELKGTSQNPEVSGKLALKKTTITPSYIGETLQIEDESIALNNREIVFKNFSFKDSRENIATLDGSISLEKLSKPEFDLSFTAKSFQFLNSTYDDNEVFYGNVVADVDASLTGSTQRPDIELQADIKDGSDFHMVISGLNKATIEESGIVRFIDKEDSVWNRISGEEAYQATQLQINNPSIKLTANASINSGTKLTIVVDPVTNEKLVFRGTANLSYAMEGTSSPSLTGRFEISDGSYSLLLYDVIRRTFTIKKGSYLQWNGEVTNALTNLTASYEVQTSPLPLIQGETSALNNESLSDYSQSLPFRVNLNINGYLLQPEIDFDLDVPKAKADALIQAKLNRLNQDEAELNKQVFSLLLFNSFLHSNAGSDQSLEYEINSTARTSVSRLLSQQLNNFARKHIKGFEVGVDVNSYIAGGTQPQGHTEVSLNVSKNLFNDRLSVQVGSDLAVEGPENQNKQDFNSIAGDVIVEYKIDKTGNYLLRGFNEKEFEDMIFGEVNKTGISFIYNQDFYRLSDLFQNDTLVSSP